MTAHRSRLRTSPETYARASLLHDGARLHLSTVADALDVEEDVAARLVAFGRLHVAGEVVILPPGCGPHLGGLVSRSQRTVLHLTTCESCQGLEAIMQRGIEVSRARWTNGAEPAPDVDAAPAPAVAAETAPVSTIEHHPLPAPPAAAVHAPVAPALVPTPPRLTYPLAVVAVPPPAVAAVRVQSFRWAPSEASTWAPSEASTWAPAEASTWAPPATVTWAPSEASTWAPPVAAAPVPRTAPPAPPASPPPPTPPPRPHSTTAVTDAMVRQVRLADPASDTRAVEQALLATLADTAPLPPVRVAPGAPSPTEDHRSRRGQVAAVIAAVVAMSGGVLLNAAMPAEDPLTATTLSAPAVATPDPAARSAAIDDAVRAALADTDPDRQVSLGTVDLGAPSASVGPAEAPSAPLGEVPSDRDVLTRALTAILRDARPQPVAPAAPAPPPAPVAQTDVTDPAVWDRLAMCESTGRWDADTGNGYFGGLQFTQSSWELVGGTGRPHEASREEQISRAQRLWAIQGWGAWPDCSTALGYR